MGTTTFTARYRTFCQTLAAARRAQGLRQVDVARRLGKPQSFVSDYERGQRRIDIIEFLALADVLKLDPCDVIRTLRRR